MEAKRLECLTVAGVGGARVTLYRAVREDI